MATPKKRTLEEFLSFSAPPAREEYVTDPSLDKEFVEGRPAMMKEENGKAVFKRNSGTLKKDLASGREVAEMKPIGVDVELEEAQMPRPKKSILPPVESPVGDPPPMAPKYTAPVAAPTPVIQPLPSSTSGPSDWERFLIGATPALVGLLSGNSLEGMELSGQTLANTEADLYKRERDFNGKIAEMKAKRAVSGSTSARPNYARQEMYDPNTGKTYVHSIVDGRDMGVLGEAAPNKVRDSYITKEMYNPETKKVEIASINPRTNEVNFLGQAAPKTQLTELSEGGDNFRTLIDRNTGEIIRHVGESPTKPNKFEGMEEGRDRRFQQQKLLDLTKEFTKPTSNFNKIKENIDGMVTAAEQLNLGNPRANAGLANYLARNVYGEKGPLSDADIARLAGDPSYGAVIDRWLDAKMNGQLNSLDRNDIRQIVEVTYALQKEKAMSEADRFGKAFATVGFDPSAGIKAYVDQAFKPLPKFVSGNITRKPRGPEKGEVQQGYKFKGGDPSKPENWEKQ